ncbi:MAG: ABC transporter permease [Cyclobacteriaceae bacterium]
MSRRVTIPRIPHAFFKWYCKSERYEEIHGDLEEFFYERVEVVGLAKARLFYLWNVIRCFQPYAWKIPQSQNSNIVMFRNYFKTSYRSMIKNPLSSFINVFGLAVAVGVCMVTYSFMDFDYSTDRFHEFKDEVYLTTFYVDRDGTEEQYGKTPAPLGEMLRQDFSSIKKVTRVHDGNAVMKHGDNVFHESVRYVDPAFLEMFTFPLKWGASSSLADPNSIILSAATSVKYFGSEDPIGKDIKAIFNDTEVKTFKVAGVAEEFPKAHIIGFDFLVNFDNLLISNSSFDLTDWKALVNATFIQVEDAGNLKVIAEGMEKYRKLQNEVEQDWAITAFNFVTVNDLHLGSAEIREDISYDGSREGRVGLPFIAAFILALACFNYINIAIVSSTKRLKEIGLRKVIGANKRLVIVQFLAENLFVTFLAGILGFFLAATVFLPWFDQFAGIGSEFNLLDSNMWIFLVSVLVFTGLVSGIYPAFYISKFEVVKIFKGTVKFGTKNTLTKVFLSVQLMLACVGITFAVMFAQNSAYQAKRDWGYKQKETLYVNVSDRSVYEQMKMAVEQNPDVTSLAGSSHHLGKASATTIVHLPDRQYEVRELGVSSSYFETMGIELENGRFFEENRESDRRSIVVNQLFVENLALTEPIGAQVKIDSIPYDIIGVSKNFHFNNFYYENLPTIFTVAEQENYRYLTMQVRSGAEQSMYESIQTQWSKLFPETPFQGGYQEDVWVGFYEDLGIMKKFTRAIAIVFVLLASLGLYGLVKLNISGRIREFSIRKTLGANVKNLAKNILSQYVLLSIAAVVFGAPLGHIMITAMIDMMFPDPRPFGFTGAAISAVILVFVLVLVISTQIMKVSKANPVEGLKVE